MAPSKGIQSHKTCRRILMTTAIHLKSPKRACDVNIQGNYLEDFLVQRLPGTVTLLVQPLSSVGDVEGDAFTQIGFPSKNVDPDLPRDSKPFGAYRSSNRKQCHKMIPCTTIDHMWSIVVQGTLPRMFSRLPLALSHFEGSFAFLGHIKTN